MIFERTFEEKLDHCNDSLRRVGRALDLIISKSDLLHDFFSIVREVGNFLNRDTNFPVVKGTFELSALQKLMQIKSPANQRISLFHWVLALMRSSDVASMFNQDDMTVLNDAKVLKSHLVFEECFELVQNLHQVNDIKRSSTYVNQEGKRQAMHRKRISVAGPAATSRASGP